MCQACYRNIQEIGLMKLYENDPQSRHLIRSFIALALLPIEMIPDGFELLKKKVQESPQAHQLKEFLIYFRKQWLNHFKPTIWSVCDSNWRTNNFAEGEKQLHDDLHRNLLDRINYIYQCFLPSTKSTFLDKSCSTTS